jgi:hypothetical protein
VLGQVFLAVSHQILRAAVLDQLGFRDMRVEGSPDGQQILLHGLANRGVVNVSRSEHKDLLGMGPPREAKDEAEYANRTNSPRAGPLQAISMSTTGRCVETARVCQFARSIPRGIANDTMIHGPNLGA